MTNCQQLSTLPATKSRHCPRLIVSRSLKSAIYKSLLQLCPQLRAGCARLREALLSQLRRRLYRHHDRRRHPALALHQDPRYFYQGTGTKSLALSTQSQAQSSAVVTKDRGSRTTRPSEATWPQLPSRPPTIRRRIATRAGYSRLPLSTPASALSPTSYRSSSYANSRRNPKTKTRAGVPLIFRTTRKRRPGLQCQRILCRSPRWEP
jgi:hypothetical protein